MEIIINTKNYKTGKELLKLAKLVEKYLPNAILAVPAADISTIAHTKIKVFAQHVDLAEEKSTGIVSIDSIKAHGARGTILNHSQHQLSFNILEKTIKECKKHNIKTVVCAKTILEVEKIANFKPYAIAFEDPELIGTGKSVTTYNPETVRNFASILRKTSILPICGAGISTAQDVKAAHNLGCKGVLMASAIANNKSPASLLQSLKKWKQ